MFVIKCTWLGSSLHPPCYKYTALTVRPLKHMVLGLQATFFLGGSLGLCSGAGPLFAVFDWRPLPGSLQAPSRVHLCRLQDVGCGLLPDLLMNMC